MTKRLMTPEFEAKALAALRQRYAAFIRRDEDFRIASHEVESDAWTLSVVFESADRSLHLPVDVALLAADNGKMANDDARDALVDFVDYFFDRYFRESREATLPIEWAPLTFGEFTVRARGWEKNLRLEELADKLLEGEPIEHLIKPRGERLGRS
jgi:hypothetical protein